MADLLFRVRGPALHIVGAVSVFLVLAGGCDPTLDPFQDNDQHYSIYGYLDASADTQFVRVEPLRDGMATRAPETMDASVTLTNLATNRTVSFQDSLFHFGEETWAHNYFTTAPIDASTRYRLVVQGPDGAESHVETRTPDPFPTPTVLTPISRYPPRCLDISNLAIHGIERLVALQALFYSSAPASPVFNFNHLPDTVHTESGVVRASIGHGPDYCEIPGNQRSIHRIEFVVAAGSPDWPDFFGLDPETRALPTTTTNVKGGVGFVGGIVSDTLVMYRSEE